MGLFKSIFTWWDGPTYGTRLWTRLFGEEVGRDEQGNRYFRTKDGDRRWVVYNGLNEASRVPSEWHGWLHKTTDVPPAESPIPRRAWEKPNRPNRTGTDEAWQRPGSLMANRPGPRATPDYEAWTPE